MSLPRQTAARAALYRAARFVVLLRKCGTALCLTSARRRAIIVPDIKTGGPEGLDLIAVRGVIDPFYLIWVMPA